MRNGIQVHRDLYLTLGEIKQAVEGLSTEELRHVLEGRIDWDTDGEGYAESFLLPNAAEQEAELQADLERDAIQYLALAHREIFTLGIFLERGFLNLDMLEEAARDIELASEFLRGERSPTNLYY